MHLLELTLPTPEENLALDEALLDRSDAAGGPMELLRLWESPRPVVVVGRSTRIDAEVRADTCRAMNVPVLRRSSGGSAVVIGPGCLMYALVLSYQLRPELRAVDRAHRIVLRTIAAAIGPWSPGVRCRGTSDLALGQRKFSGNSVRAKRSHLLYHGTLLYDFSLDLIGRLLAMPERQPDYREGRDHDTFLMNLPVGREDLRRALIAAWNADLRREDWPEEDAARLVAEKYARKAWNDGHA